jgi:hypothetical protein
MVNFLITQHVFDLKLNNRSRQEQGSRQGNMGEERKAGAGAGAGGEKEGQEGEGGGGEEGERGRGRGRGGQASGKQEVVKNI